MKTRIKYEDEYLDTKEVARMLCMSPRTLEGWRLRREGPPWVRVGVLSVRYNRRELLKWLNAWKVKPK